MRQETIRLTFALTFAAIWTTLIWLVKLTELVGDVSFAAWGVRPREVEGLVGIITGPLIHGGVVDHLVSNSLSLFPLAATLMFFYPKVTWRVVIGTWLAAGIGVWLAGRYSSHIGASGVIYGLAFFLFASGVFRRDVLSLAISLIVVFFHGSMVWGLFPFFQPENVSWEGHLFGALGGIGLAFAYRKVDRPPPRRYRWEDEPDDPNETGLWDYREQAPPPPGFHHPEKK